MQKAGCGAAAGLRSASCGQGQDDEPALEACPSAAGGPRGPADGECTARIRREPVLPPLPSFTLSVPPFGSESPSVAPVPAPASGALSPSRLLFSLPAVPSAPRSQFPFRLCPASRLCPLSCLAALVSLLLFLVFVLAALCVSSLFPGLS